MLFRMPSQLPLALLNLVLNQISAYLLSLPTPHGHVPIQVGNEPSHLNVPTMWVGADCMMHTY